MTAPAPVADCPLSARELQIVEHVSSGYSNSTIGEKLNLSPLTIKSHLARIGQKVGTGDRAHIVAVCFRAGWLT